MGRFEVTKIIKFDAETNRLFYISTEDVSTPDESNPKLRNLFFVTLDKSSLRRHAMPSRTCMSCNSGAIIYRECSNFDISTQSTNYFVAKCKGPGVPYTALYSFNDTDMTAPIRFLEENLNLEQKTNRTRLPVIKYRTWRNGLDFQTPQSSRVSQKDYTIRAKILLPPNVHLLPKLPIMVHVYAGPGYQFVDNKFKVDWDDFLVTNRSMAVVYIDGRGSGYDGSDLRFAVNRQLGKYEIDDQIEGVKLICEDGELSKRLDCSRIAIMGWSYGGYASAMALTRDEAPFQCGISVAPVTDWKMYDSVYTERYMGPYDTNKASYDEQSSLIDIAERPYYISKHDRKYLLIHGTGDDNVHFRHTALWEEQLVAAGVQHDVQFYTDQKHGISDHLYRKMTYFLDDCFIK